MSMPALEVTRFLAEVSDPFVPVHETRLRWLLAKGKRLLQNVPAGDFEQAAQAWSFIGLCHARLREHQDALACHRAAYRLQPRGFLHLNNVGAALLELGQASEAIDPLVDCYENGGRNTVATLANLAEAFAMLGQREDAIEMLREAMVAADPSDPSDLYCLAQGAAALDLDQEAIELFARAMAIHGGVAIGDTPALEFIEALPCSVMDELVGKPGGDHLITAIDRTRRFGFARDAVAGIIPPRGGASAEADAAAVGELSATRCWRANANAARLVHRSSACGT